MAVKPRSPEDVKQYWESTWTKMGMRLIHIRDIPAIIVMKTGLDDDRAKADLKTIADALNTYARGPAKEMDAAVQKEFWEATWQRLGKQVLFFGDVPAMLDLPATLKGQQLADTLRAMAGELGDYARQLEAEMRGSKVDTTDDAVAPAAVEVG